MTRGVPDELQDVVSPSDKHLHIEYLDGRRMVDDADYFAALHHMFARKYTGFHPDVILISNDYALNFMLREGEPLFAQTPVVFCGINVYQLAKLQSRPNYTGLLKGTQIGGNLALLCVVWWG